jgi:hypothetical protein
MSSFFEHGFLLRKDKFTTIEVPGTSGTGAFAINSEGDIEGDAESTSTFVVIC